MLLRLEQHLVSWFASIVSELIIGNYDPLQTITSLMFLCITNNHSSCCEVKLPSRIAVFHCNHYVVITIGFSITTTLEKSKIFRCTFKLSI